MYSFVTVNIEIGEHVGGLIDRRAERAEILSAETGEWKGISGDGERDECSGELRRRNEQSRKGHRSSVLAPTHIVTAQTQLWRPLSTCPSGNELLKREHSHGLTERITYT